MKLAIYFFQSVSRSFHFDITVLGLSSQEKCFKILQLALGPFSKGKIWGNL
jgi:hypothetical protein